MYCSRRSNRIRVTVLLFDGKEHTTIDFTVWGSRTVADSWAQRPEGNEVRLSPKLTVCKNGCA